MVLKLDDINNLEFLLSSFELMKDVFDCYSHLIEIFNESPLPLYKNSILAKADLEFYFGLKIAKDRSRICLGQNRIPFWLRPKFQFGLRHIWGHVEHGQFT